MASDKTAETTTETVLVGNYEEMESEEKGNKTIKSSVSNFFWNGGSAYDAWFSCSSNQVIFLNNPSLL